MEGKDERLLYELIGEESDEKCPDCRASIFKNKIGDKWCGNVECAWSSSEELSRYISSLNTQQIRG
jgi:hypothetical protein